MARTSRTPKIRLGELLVAAGLVTDDKIRQGLEEQRRNNLFLGESLVQLGFVSEEAIAQAIIQHFNLPFLSASQFTIPPEVFNLFPERMYHEYQFIAVDKIERVIIIIAAGPINQDMMEELERVSECRICHYVSTWRDIVAAIQRNSKDLGGDAQVELTGLGSLLLEVPAPNKAPGVSITQRIKKLEPTNNGEAAAKPAAAAKTAAALSMVGQSSKPVNAANLSAMLTAQAASSRTVGGSFGSPSAPPSPRLTAFIKVPPPGSAPGGMPAESRVASSANLHAVKLGGSSANLHSVKLGGTSSSGLPAVRKDKDDPADGGQPQKRAPSFLTVKK